MRELGLCQLSNQTRTLRKHVHTSMESAPISLIYGARRWYIREAETDREFQEPLDCPRSEQEYYYGIQTYTSAYY